MASRMWRFVGGQVGEFEVSSLRVVRGEGLPQVSHLSVSNEPSAASSSAAPRTSSTEGGPAGFVLHGVVSNERYVTRSEKTELQRIQQAIGREGARLGALIPIRKSQAWWDLSQDERRAIFEDRSAHIALGMRALPAVARRLHHCRDLGEPQPFDFLTWFDFAEQDQSAFDDLLGALRATEEWQYIEREVELRVVRTG